MATATVMSELEVAIAALPAKKQRLRESFDRLLAASPIPIPFTWADIDAHISSLQSYIALHFRQLQAHQDAALRTTAEHQHQHQLRGKGQDNSEEEEEDWARPNHAPSNLNAGEEGSQGSAEMAIDVSPDQYDAVEEGEASPGLEPQEGRRFLALNQRRRRRRKMGGRPSGRLRTSMPERRGSRGGRRWQSRHLPTKTTPLKKLRGCASNLLAHEDIGRFEEAHHWNIQAKFYNEKFPLVYESDNIGDSLS